MTTLEQAAWKRGRALADATYSHELNATRIEIDTECARHYQTHNAQARPVDAEPVDRRVHEALLELQAWEPCAGIADESGGGACSGIRKPGGEG